MNPGIYIPQQHSMPPIGMMNVGEMLALPGFERRPAKIESRPTVSIDHSDENIESIIDNALAALDKVVIRAIEARTEAEYRATVEGVSCLL